MAAGTTYAKRYVGGWVDGSAGGTPIDAVALNAMEVALLQMFGASAPNADGQVPIWVDSVTKFGYAKILNANVDPAAAIVKSKLDFTGANGIVNADIASAAAIAKSKLAALALVNADVDPAAAIAASKIASVPVGFKVAGTYALVSSTTESSLISGIASSATTGWQIPANTLGAAGGFRFRVQGSTINNSGGAQSLTFKVRFGNTTLWGQANNHGNGATRAPFVIEGILANVNATNINNVVGHRFAAVSSLIGGAGTVAGIQMYGDGIMNDILFASTGNSAIDTTAAQYFDVTALLGASSASFDITRTFASLEYIL